MKAAEGSGEKIHVEGNSVNFDNGQTTISITTKGSPQEKEGQITGEVETISMKSIPVSAKVPESGVVSASFQAELKSLPTSDSKIGFSISEIPDASSRSAFERAAADKGYQIDAIAYTMQVEKTNLEDQKDIGAATVTMSVAPLWVLNHGGITNVKIARFADDGSSQVLDTQFTGLDRLQNMVFTGTSPGGLSIFAVIAVKNPQIAVAVPVIPPVSSTQSNTNQGTSAMAFVPPSLLLASLTLIRRF